MSIADIICTKRHWKFNGCLIRPEDNSRNTAYPAIGLMCEALAAPSPAVQQYHSWVPEPAPQGTITTYTTAPAKALTLKMHEPPVYQHHLHENHPLKFPPQGPLSTQFKEKFEKLVFVESGARLLSNPMTIDKDPSIKGGAKLNVTFEIHLLPFNGAYSMIVTGIWSDGYLGTGGWC